MCRPLQRQVHTDLVNCADWRGWSGTNSCSPASPPVNKCLYSRRWYSILLCYKRSIFNSEQYTRRASPSLQHEYFIGPCNISTGRGSRWSLTHLVSHTSWADAGKERLRGTVSDSVSPALHLFQWWKNISLPSIMESIKTLLPSPFFFLVLVYVLTGSGAGLFIPYFNIYFVQHLNASPALFGLIDGGANAMTALLTLIAPALAKRTGRINTSMLTRLVSIPLLLTIGLTSILPLAAFLYLFRQGTMDMSAGILQVFSMESVSKKYRGLANSSYQVAFQVPSALSAPLGGLIIVHLGYSPIFLLGAFCYILTIIILWSKFGWRRGGRSDGTEVKNADTPIPLASQAKQD